MSFVLKNNSVAYFDVDDTLVLYEWPADKFNETILIGVKKEDGTYEVPPIRLWPHKEHIARLKQFKPRHQGLVVWSQGGAEWAQAVVEALELSDYVDAILCKPKWIFDDLPPSAWIGDRSYVDPVTGASLRKINYAGQ